MRKNTAILTVILGVVAGTLAAQQNQDLSGFEQLAKRVNSVLH